MTFPGSRLLRFVLLSALAISLSPCATAAVPTPIPPAGPVAPIRLRAGAFDPANGAGPEVPADLRIDAYPVGLRGYYIVQFVGPVQEAWKANVGKLGGLVLDYVPEFAFIVYMDEATRSAVAGLPEVAWIGDYRPVFKLSPDLAGAKGTRDLVVQAFPVEPLNDLIAQLQTLGVAIGDSSDSPSGGLLRVQVDAGLLDALAAIPAVRWIEPFYERVLFNDVARGDAIMAAETAWTDLGLFGQGQIVAVSDTGLDTGNLGTLHQDFLGSPTGCSGTGRIAATYALGRTNDWSDSCQTGGVNEGGHGTHVSGSVLGNGCRSGSGGAPDYSGSYAGLAPQARLVMQSVMDSFCTLGGLPSNLNDLFSQARTAGARIHTNSWGSAVAGQYTTDARSTDLFTWNNKDYTILFSAGNEGADTNPADGFIDTGSIGSPATAKNAISIGASENYRLMGGATSSYGAYWPSDYPAEPIKSDRVSDNAGGMVAFSSRGPTDDGRIKPDVVAPGTNILSTKSQGTYVSDGWGAGPSIYYQYMGGTSMATPLTAGAVALIRQFYTDIKGITPSAALLKATLINSATDLYPGQYASPLEHQPRLPNYAQGWGRVNVANATDDTHAWQDIADANGLATGASHSYIYESCGASVFKASLVWTDYPGATLAAKELVNDLDLTVTAPDGTTYRGNVFANGWSAAGGAADRTNNVESVYLQSPAAGNWTITVSGYNVPNGPQGYGLVVDGICDFTLRVTPAAQSICAPADAAYNVSVGTVGGFTGWVDLVVSGNPAGTTAGFSANPVTPPANSTLTIGNTGAAAAGAYALTITGVSGSLSHQDTVTLNISAPLAAGPALAAPLDGSTGVATTPTFAWGAVSGAASYDLQVATDPGFSSLVINQSGLTATSYTPGSALAADTVYYWGVTAVNGCGSRVSTVDAFRTAAVSCKTYTSSDVPKTISWMASPVDSTVAVADSFALTDVNVTIGQITHASDQELDIYIRHPDSTQIELSTDNGDNGDNYVNTIFDDEAVTAVTSGSAPFTGSYRPEGLLSNLDGKSSNGTWTLRISDDTWNTNGTLSAWSLTLCGGTPAAPADYSDLAATYGIAWHTGAGALRLGGAWTADSSFLAGDDNASDDGISFVTAVQAGGNATVRVNVQGTPAAGRWLRLWFDWDGDGAFASAELAYDGAAAAGDNDLTVSVPSSVAATVAYRARLYDSAAAPASAPPAPRLRGEADEPVASLQDSGVSGAATAASPQAWGVKGAATAASPQDWGVGGATGGEVEDGFAPCIAPGSVSSMTIARLDASQVRLTWAAAAGADHYEVWYAADDPYFAPGADCAAPGAYGCEPVFAATDFEHASLGNAANHTYVVRAVSACGAVSDVGTPRVGEFEFILAPGSG